MKDEFVVLVVDDEQIVLDSVQRHLRHEKLETIKASSGMEALEMMNAKKVDIVLTDLMMPEMDGFELMHEIRQKYPGVPVIAITGYATISTALQSLQMGAFDYIAKPFTKSELLGVIHRAIGMVKAFRKASVGGATVRADEEEQAFAISSTPRKIGDNTWMMKDESGNVTLGAERPFLLAVGRIQSIYLPENEENIKQGGVFFRIFSADMRAHTLLSPLTGKVIEVNLIVVDHPEKVFDDPYGDGWLIKLKPQNFDTEIKLLGL